MMNDEPTLGGDRGAETLPDDFAQYLGERLCLPVAEALSVLGRCLLDYEPLVRLDSSER